MSEEERREGEEEREVRSYKAMRAVFLGLSCSQSRVLRPAAQYHL